jgi:Flp pilus assembly protein TadG
MLRRHLPRDKGQAFVELALVLPVFTLMLVGIAEVGRLAYASIEVNNAARAGAAYAAQDNTTAADTTNIQLAATQDAPDLTSLSATPSYSCTCESNTGTMTAPGACTGISTASGSCPSPSRIVVYVQVNTTAPVATLFHFPGIASSVTLRGQAIMRVQQ